MDQNQEQGTFGKRFFPLFILGCIGILSLIPTMYPLIVIQMETSERLARLSPITATIISLVQPAFFLAALTALGTFLSPALGLRSRLAEMMSDRTTKESFFKKDLLISAGTGILLGVVILGLEQVFQAMGARLDVENGFGEGSVKFLLSGLLYGGMTEELMLRWGLVTLFAYAGWKFLQKKDGLPSPYIMWASILLAALIFGLAHLPALAGISSITVLLVIRTVFLNALAGVFYGWLYWKRNIESAMIAHAATHVAFYLSSL